MIRPKTRVAVLVVVALGALAGASSVVADAEDRRLLTVVGQGEVSVPPDTATVTFSVVTEADEPGAAATRNAEVASRVVAAVKSLLGEGDRVLTTGYSLDPKYENPREGGRQIVGYVARNRVRVETSDLEGVGELLDTGIGAGAAEVGSLAFSLEDDQAAVRRAILAAGRDAKARAKTLAESLGVSLGALVSASTDGARPGPIPMVRQATAMARESAPTPVEAGDVRVSASVTASWLIVD